MANYDGITRSCGLSYSLRENDMASTKMLAAVSDASSGHLRCCSDADTVKMSLSREKDAYIPSWPTTMGH
eukprot:scaffold17082_cov150-Skeletonema_dohrnii-CCMP3373.AAC.1